MVRPRLKKIKSSQSSDFAYWYHSLLFITWLGLLVWLLLLVDPVIVKDVGWQNSYLPLYLLIGLSAGWLIGILRRAIGKGLVWGLLISLFLMMYRYGLGTLINGGLLVMLLIIVEWYWSLGRQDLLSHRE